jgi:putative phosphoesterase
VAAGRPRDGRLRSARELATQTLKVAVVSDTHLPRGARRLPDACVEALRSADLVLHAGDVVTAAALAELEALGPPVVAVHGNVDAAELRATLPAERVVELGHICLGMLHDAGPEHGREARLVERFRGCAAIVYGHTHLPQVECRDGVWILNPGSPTERRRAPVRTMIVLTVAGKTLAPRLVELP